MIRKLIDRLLGRPTLSVKARTAHRYGQRREVPASEHGIDPRAVDAHALQVVRTLKKAGFEAFIVGGAVRDLLLGLRPKDFDVATNATPEQVKALFGGRGRLRAFIIGKRFQIVHVVHGRGREHEVIEVSTFRAFVTQEDSAQVSGNERTSKRELARVQHATDANGRVLRDNVWGPQDQDATRRDFTVNALYYEPDSGIVVDFHHGIEDARARRLRMIGDAAERYREDPVRIIRAVRFGAKLSKLGFTLDEATTAPMLESLPLLAQVPQSRLFDEMLKLLQTGHAVASITQLRSLGLERGIYPLLDVVVERADDPIVSQVLTDTDRRVAKGKSVVPSFLLAGVLWRDVQTAWDARLAHGQHTYPALQEAIDSVFERRIGDVSGRGKLAADMREIWVMQPRFEKRTGNAPFVMVGHQRFRAAFDFLVLRAQAGQASDALVQWWTTFATTEDDALRYDLIAQARTEQQARARAQQKQASAQTAPSITPQEGQKPVLGQLAPQEDALNTEVTPAKRRRRRPRRKPATDTNPDKPKLRDVDAGDSAD